MKSFLKCLILSAGCSSLVSSVAAAGSKPEIAGLQAFQADEARQAVAVDSGHVYAIDNQVIGKYDKFTGERVATWVAPEDSNIHHLNSGVVVGGRLYAAHSNYPGVPMVSSIEVWDTETLQHSESRSFGIYEGSATWVDFHRGSWWVAFANYETRGGVPGKGPEWTTIVQFDADWSRREAWVLPSVLIEKMAPYSNSGGGWGPDGYLYLTGHDAAALYRMKLPAFGSHLELVAEVPVPFEGQGIAWDTTGPVAAVYGLARSTRTVVRVELEP